MKRLLSVQDLKVTVEEKSVLRGINLEIGKGEVHAIMGPNGSGKSSLALTLMGHPRYKIKRGTIIFRDKVINELSPDKRAQLGMFLAMQHPYEIDGVPYKDFLRQAYNALYDETEKQLRIRDFHRMLLKKVKMLKMDESFIDRPINVGFSGGEKKRAEVLQLAVLQPKLAILDEIDSGLDIDALRIVCEGLQTIKQENPAMSVILITHYQRILRYFKSEVVHVIQDGKIMRSGDATLAEQLEIKGYAE